MIEVSTSQGCTTAMNRYNYNHLTLAQLFELLVMISQNIFVRSTNQHSYLTYYIIMTMGTLAANYMVHVKLMYRFIYSVLLNVTVLIFHLVVDYHLVWSYFNFRRVCQMLVDYYDSNVEQVVVGKVEARNICNSNATNYLFLLISLAIVVIFKLVALYFAVKAHLSLLNKIHRRKSDTSKIKTS
jgi:hypothetical protein